MKNEIASRLGLDASTLKLFTDNACRKPLGGRDADTLTKIGLKNGDMLHVSNQNAQITNLPPPPKQFKPIEEKKEGDSEMKDEKAKPLLDSSGKVIKVPEKKEETVAKDSYGRVIKQVNKEEKPKEVRMIAGSTDK